MLSNYSILINFKAAHFRTTNMPHQGLATGYISNIEDTNFTSPGFPYKNVAGYME